MLRGHKHSWQCRGACNCRLYLLSWDRSILKVVYWLYLKEISFWITGKKICSLNLWAEQQLLQRYFCSTVSLLLVYLEGRLRRSLLWGGVFLRITYSLKKDQDCLMTHHLTKRKKKDHIKSSFHPLLLVAVSYLLCLPPFDQLKWSAASANIISKLQCLERKWRAQLTYALTARGPAACIILCDVKGKLKRNVIDQKFCGNRKESPGGNVNM